MYKNKRKRDAIEATVFERNVKTRLKSDSLGPKDSKTISFPKRLSIEDTINSFPLKKSSIRTTSSKLSTSQITTFQDKASNKLFQYLLEKDKSNIVKEAEKLKEGLKNAIIQSFTPEEISFHKEGRSLLKENQELEPKVKASIEYLLKIRENLKELSAFEEKSKRELQSLTITQMMLNSEMQEKINSIKESIHARRMCLGGMRRCYIEKRKITNCLLDNIQGKNATAEKVNQIHQMNEMRHKKIETERKNLEQIINDLKGKIQLITQNLMRINHEYFKENNSVRILEEQIHYVKGGPKAIAMVLPLNTNNNPFDYEPYFKITNVQTISLVNSDKFSIKLSSISPSKKNQHIEPPPMKWVYSNSTFSLDTLIYENRQTSFYNYDCIKKLYDQIEIFLKLSLYPDGDSILRKLSFNRPEFKKILKIEKLTYHMNIDPESQKNDPGQNTDLFDHNINLKEKASLFITNAPIENKVAILFFGSINLNMTSRLIENIYNDLGSFENDIIKINCVNFKIGFQDNDLHKRDTKSFEEFGQFSRDFNEHVQTDLYQSHLVVTITFEIQNLLNDTQYSKRLNLIFVDAKNIENIDRFVRQFKMVLNKEKIITTKDKMVERLEQYLKGVHRFLMIGELPNLIKKGHRAQDEYMNLRNILDLMIKIKK